MGDSASFVHALHFGHFWAAFGGAPLPSRTASAQRPPCPPDAATRACHHRPPRAQRMRKANSAIRGSQHWRHSRGRHFVLAAGPRAQWALGGELRRSLRGSILANEEGWGGLEWCARVIVPYFGHSKLAGATMERVLRTELGLPPMRSRSGGSAAAEDDARHEPELAAPAFSMGAADGAPQEGRMVDFQVRGRMCAVPPFAREPGAEAARARGRGGMKQRAEKPH